LRSTSQMLSSFTRRTPSPLPQASGQAQAPEWALPRFTHSAIVDLQRVDSNDSGSTRSALRSILLQLGDGCVTALLDKNALRARLRSVMQEKAVLLVLLNVQSQEQCSALLSGCMGPGSSFVCITSPGKQQDDGCAGSRHPAYNWFGGRNGTAPVDPQEFGLTEVSDPGATLHGWSLQTLAAAWDMM